MELFCPAARFRRAGGMLGHDGSGSEKCLPLLFIQRIPVHAEALQGVSNDLLDDLRLLLQQSSVKDGPYWLRGINLQARADGRWCQRRR